MTEPMRHDPDLLRSSQILQDASPSLVKAFDDASQTKQLANGATVFEQGDEGDSLYVLSSGLLEVSIVSIEGRKLSLNRMQKGEVFGEIALLDPGPRTATVSAIERSLLISVSRKRLFDLLETRPDLALEMLNLAGKRLRWVSGRLEEFVFLPLEVRLALKILHFAQTGAGGDTIAMSQSDLADHVGATREAVSKTLSKWRRVGAVEIKRGAVVVLNHGALEDIACHEII